ncbi:hypothetical protein WJX84_011454 [Apatococcus fuscideae]|uniref:Uncharacterized protein n=1 Tax=Apatococcus fuscideae TaxID=2026836 RepID=A0AAW1TBA1_9CHLO
MTVTLEVLTRPGFLGRAPAQTLFQEHQQLGRQQVEPGSRTTGQVQSAPVKGATCDLCLLFKQDTGFQAASDTDLPDAMLHPEDIPFARCKMLKHMGMTSQSKARNSSLRWRVYRALPGTLGAERCMRWRLETLMAKVGPGEVAFQPDHQPGNVKQLLSTTMARPVKRLAEMRARTIKHSGASSPALAHEIWAACERTLVICYRRLGEQMSACYGNLHLSSSPQE